MYLTPDDVKEAIKAMPITENGKKDVINRSEVKELPNILHDDETLMDIVGGFYDQGSGILVATTKRLIFVYKGLMWGMKVEDFPFDRISSIQYETGMLSGELVIFASGNKATIKAVMKDRCRVFCENVRTLIVNSKQESKPSPQSSGSDDMLGQLERLSVLHNSGALTDEEFTLAKKKLLS